MGLMPDVLRIVAKAVWADGGQRAARRNAWAAMSADAKRARERAEAAEVMATAVAAAGPTQASVGADASVSQARAVGS
jgi:hypothetical protein